MLALAAGCEGRPRTTPPRGDVPAVESPPPVLECRYEPTSPADGGTASGYQMCFTPARSPPRSQRDSGGPGIAVDAGPVPADPPCPAEMVLVEGEYCPDVRHRCERYVDAHANKGYLATARCAVFDRHPRCVGGREHRRFCIDRDEHAPEGSGLPLVNQSWTMARETCRSLGKRLCFGSEWEFACEGEDMLPYPYGFVRDSKRCNHDRKPLSRRGKLLDHRVPSSARPRCTSPFGVRNLVGNVDEWVYRDGFVRPWRSSLRGGWWLAGRNNCRAATTAHDEVYFGPQTGFRCCRNPLR